MRIHSPPKYDKLCIYQCQKVPDVASKGHNDKQTTCALAGHQCLIVGSAMCWLELKNNNK